MRTPHSEASLQRARPRRLICEAPIKPNTRRKAEHSSIMADYLWDVFQLMRPGHHCRRNAIFPDCYGELHRDYIIEPRIIGEGSFGTVRRVQLRSDRGAAGYYACKTILKRQYEDQDLLRREVINLNRCCQHPNVVQLLDVVEDRHAVHLVMEGCTGGELYSRVLDARNHRPPPPGCHPPDGPPSGLGEETSAAVVHQILSAVAYCHEVGHVCHRDLKASNFLFVRLGPDAELRVIDFGLSKHVAPALTAEATAAAAAKTAPADSPPDAEGPLLPGGGRSEADGGGDDDSAGTTNGNRDATGSPTSSPAAASPPGTMDAHDGQDAALIRAAGSGGGYMTSEVGTPYYVAPEVLTQDAYTTKCDVWSVGAIAYLCLTGRLPVQGADERDTVKRLMDPDLEVDLAGDVWRDDGPLSASARDFCRALLQRDPDGRPTAREALGLDWMVWHCGDPPDFPPPLGDGEDPPLPRLSQRNKGRQLHPSSSLYEPFSPSSVGIRPSLEPIRPLRRTHTVE